MGNYMNHEVMIDKFTTTEVAGETFGGFKCDKYEIMKLKISNITN